MIRINLLGHEAVKPRRRSVPEFKVGGSENAPFILAVVATVGQFSMTCCTTNAFDVTPPDDAPTPLAD